MKTATKQQYDPNVLAVMHQAGGGWCGVIAQTGGNGRGETESAPTILAYRKFTGEQQSQISAWLDEYQASEIIGVLHASDVICRTCTLPNAPSDQLLPALRLQAESHLLGIAPPHRVGMSVIDAAPGETSRIGLVLAWPESRSDHAAGYPIPMSDRRVTFAPDIAGLAALLNGHRPTQPMLWVDRADGCCAAVMTHATGAVFRGLREDEQNAEQWTQGIGRALAETALNAGHSSTFIDAMVRVTHERLGTLEPGEAGLFVSDDVIRDAASRIENAPTDPSWWNQFGISAGVLLARCGKLNELTNLLEHEPQEKPSPIRAAIDMLSRPATARYAIIACLLVLLFGPLAMSALRAGVLQMQYNRVSDQLAAIQQTENMLVVYRQLNSEAWPMTKVLADIASCTPEGIELENLHVRQQQTFTLQGRALPTDGRTAPQVVELMREQLRATGIFDDIRLNWGQGDAYGNYEFGLTARLHRPFRRFEYPPEQDFAKWTLADRREGVRPGTPREDDELDVPREREDLVRVDPQPDRASEPEPSEWEEHASAPSSGRRSGPAPVDRSTLPGGAGSPRSARSGGGVRPSEDIPEPLSESEIRNMSHSEVSDMLVKISGARRIARRGDDQELTDRLQREFDLLMERMREAAADE